MRFRCTRSRKTMLTSCHTFLHFLGNEAFPNINIYLDARRDQKCPWCFATRAYVHIICVPIYPLLDSLLDSVHAYLIASPHLCASRASPCISSPHLPHLRISPHLWISPRTSANFVISIQPSRISNCHICKKYVNDTNASPSADVIASPFATDSKIWRNM